MGCDIHMYKEKFENDTWVTANTWKQDPEYPDEVKDIPWTENNIDRNYGLFSLIANGVRGTSEHGIEPKGLPDSVCTLVRDQADAWNGDGHNHSHLSITELRKLATILLLDDTQPGQRWILQGLHSMIALFPKHVNGDTHRIVFWFDN
jgi:hypothetical protein